MWPPLQATLITNRRGGCPTTLRPSTPRASICPERNTPLSVNTQRTLINLIRHGQTDWNLYRKYQGTSDIPLNATGREQARLLAESMRGERWDAMYSSDLSRALDTALAVAGAIDFPDASIIQDSRLRERGYGAAEGSTLEEREAKFPGGDWSGLESWEDAAARSMKAVRDAAVAHAGASLLVVCHGGIINAILATLSDGEVGTGKTVIENTSRTTIEISGDHWEIGTINDIRHLEGVTTP